MIRYFVSSYRLEKSPLELEHGLRCIGIDIILGLILLDILMLDEIIIVLIVYSFV